MSLPISIILPFLNESTRAYLPTRLKTVKKQQLGKAMSTGVHLSILQVCDGQRGLLNSLTTQASGLPPSRLGYDYQIPLVPGVGPISKRYRYDM